jgi:hypothetical protein
MEQAGVSTAQLSKELRVSQPTVVRWRHGMQPRHVSQDQVWLALKKIAEERLSPFERLPLIVRANDPRLARRIIDTVCRRHGVKFAAILRRDNRAAAARLRFLIEHLLHSCAALHDREIARLLRRDDTSVRHGLRALRNEMDVSPKLRGQVQQWVNYFTPAETPALTVLSPPESPAKIA